MATKSSAGKGSGRRTSQVPSEQFMQNWKNTFSKRTEPASVVGTKPVAEASPEPTKQMYINPPVTDVPDVKPEAVKPPVAIELGTAYKYVSQVNGIDSKGILGRITAIEGNAITFTTPTGIVLSMHCVAAQHSLRTLEPHEITQLANLQKIADDGKDAEQLLSRAHMLKKPNYFMWQARKPKQITIVEHVINNLYSEQIMNGSCKVITGKITHPVAGVIYYMLARFNRQSSMERVYFIDDEGDITTGGHVVTDKWKELFNAEAAVAEEEEWKPSTAVVVDILNPTPKKENES